MFVTTTGTPTFQWFKDDEEIQGATQVFFAIANASPEDAGIYHVVAMNECNTAVSNDAVVTVLCGAPCPDCGTGP